MSETDFSKSARKYKSTTRYATSQVFFKKLHNGETKRRDWLIYSEKCGSIFCFPCTLFGTTQTEFNQQPGFQDWKNAGARIDSHESSSHHRESVFTFITRGSLPGRIDAEFERQILRKRDYWRNVLHRVAATVKFLAIRGLPFRGSEEKFGSTHNGNFMGSLEYLSEFDPFIKQHIEKYGNGGTGNVSYLSSTICDEFILLMAKTVTDAIIEEIVAAKYYGIEVDSSPDFSHVDQLSFIFRYVCSKTHVPIERFLAFLPMFGHTANAMENMVVDFINKCNLDVKNIRGQSYDNASNMAGKYSGLQARIKSLCKFAAFAPCAGHSLNLVGSCAAESCPAALSFFGFLQEVYVYFSASTHRWDILTKHLSEKNLKVPKRLSDTRWSARADACQALESAYEEIQRALEELRDDQDQAPATRSEARALLPRFQQLETGVLTSIWNSILQRFNKTSKTIQAVHMDLSTVVELYTSLESYVQSVRDSYDDFESKGKTLSGMAGYT